MKLHREILKIRDTVFNAILARHFRGRPKLIVKNIIEVPLVDLGTVRDAHFSGVFAPSAELNTVGQGVTRQFLEDAETYHEKYFDVGYSRYLLTTALDLIQLPFSSDLILDIGSGSGPSVFALMEKFPQSHIVATDISPNLLALLRMALKEKGKSDSCTTVCLDLNRPWFKGQPFQLAVGSAILHHLFEPDRLIEAVFSSIRPGGAIVFFEPFEPGYAVMSLVYRLILAHTNFANPLSGTLADFFRNKIAQIVLMKCEPKDVGVYATIDDKWMFTRSYFMEIGERIGASKVIVHPINQSDQPLTNHLKVTLRLGLNMQPPEVPPWVWVLVADIEDSLSAACKKDLLLEGCIAFLK